MRIPSFLRCLVLLGLSSFFVVVPTEARRFVKKTGLQVQVLGKNDTWPFTVEQTRPTNPPKEKETSLRAGRDMGTTACQCICGDRMVWHRELFKGDVEAKQETYCREELCPRVMVPGLKVTAECTYHADSAKVTGGTICSCDCGTKKIWQNKMFYGDVRDEKEKECLDKVCPNHAMPGLKSDAICTYKEDLFAKDAAERFAAPGLLFSLASLFLFGYY